MTTFFASVLTVIRDFVVAAALAWVGVSVEQVDANVESDRTCATDTCPQSGE